MYNYYYTKAQTLMSIANAIHALTNTNAGLTFPNAFISNINALSMSISNTGLTKRYFEGTLTIKDIEEAPYLFENFLNPEMSEETINFNNCLTVGIRALNSGHQITNVNLPVCSLIDYSGMSRARIKHVSIPNCTEIRWDAFRSVSFLEEIYAPKCLIIGNSAFRDCERLSYISFPQCQSIGNNFANGCHSLTMVNLPYCTSAGEDAFNGCAILTDVTMPRLRLVPSSMFRTCGNLSQITLYCSKINQSAFYQCTRLNTLYLLSTKMVILADYYVFSFTSMRTPQAKIYVPQSLVNTYKTNSQWKTFSNAITGI